MARMSESGGDCHCEACIKIKVERYNRKIDPRSTLRESRLHREVRENRTCPDESGGHVRFSDSECGAASGKGYVGDDMKKCELGLYEIFWKSGGSSLAAVGNMLNGIRWIAPCNWTSSSNPTGILDDLMVDSIERMVLL